MMTPIRTRFVAFLLMLSAIAVPSIVFAAPLKDGILSDRTSFVVASNSPLVYESRTPTHRGLSKPAPAPAKEIKSEESVPSSRNPAIGTSASGMGTTDNTMSSSTGSEGLSTSTR